MRRRLLYVYYGAVVISIRRAGKRMSRDISEWLKRVARRLAVLGEDSTPRWTMELFHRCYLADAEFQLGMKTVRGPMYAAYAVGNTLSFRMNWLAEKASPFSEWDFSRGTGILNLALKKPSTPYKLKDGDVWFTFKGGYAVLYVGHPRKHLEFKGPPNTLRKHTYF